jgi:hypothetical protein
MLRSAMLKKTMDVVDSPTPLCYLLLAQYRIDVGYCQFTVVGVS